MKVRTLLRYFLCCASIAVCAFANLHSAGAKPARPTVVVFGVDRHSEFADEAINRLQGELRAAGYEPSLRLLTDLQNVESNFAGAAADKSVAAVFVLREGKIEQTAEFLLWQPRSQRQQQRTIDLSHEPPARAARLLAIRVAEFLRSQTAILPPGQAQPQAAVSPEPPPAPFVPRVVPQISLGVGVLTDALRSPQMGLSANVGFARTFRPNASFIFAPVGSSKWRAARYKSPKRSPRLRGRCFVWISASRGWLRPGSPLSHLHPWEATAFRPQPRCSQVLPQEIR